MVTTGKENVPFYFGEDIYRGNPNNAKVYIPMGVINVMPFCSLTIYERADLLQPIRVSAEIMCCFLRETKGEREDVRREEY